MNHVQTFRAIETGLVSLVRHQSEADSEFDKVSLRQSACLICSVGDNWFQKVQEVFTREGVDPLFVIATLGAVSMTAGTNHDGTLSFNPIRMGDKGELSISPDDLYGCVSIKEFLDALAKIWPRDR